MQLTKLQWTLIYVALEDYVNSDNRPDNIEISWEILSKLDQKLYNIKQNK